MSDLKCQCKLSSGIHSGERCDRPAKFPPNAPTYCGYHKNCKNIYIFPKNEKKTIESKKRIEIKKNIEQKMYSKN